MRWRILSVLAVCILPVLGGPVVDSMRHDIVPITPKSYDSQIGKFRNSHVGAVLLHANTNQDREFVESKFNVLAKNLKGIARISSLDCVEHKKFCESEWGPSGDFPKIVLLPPNPLPFSIFEGSIDDLEKALLRLVPRLHVVNIAPTSIESFLLTNPSIPKVVLISTKVAAPPLFHAIANSLSDRMSFGFVSMANDDTKPIVERLQATKRSLPSIVLTKGSPGTKPEFYSGKLKYSEIFDWLNIHSETFVRGGGFSEELSEEKARPWLQDPIPEVTRESHTDICFKGTRGLCLIYLREGQLEEEERAMLLEASGKTLGLGTRGTYMWMDLEKEINFKQLFEVTSDQLPTLAVFNPSKKLRFAVYSHKTTKLEDITSFVDQIAGGLKFTVVKGRKLPKFVSRSAQEEL